MRVQLVQERVVVRDNLGRLARARRHIVHITADIVEGGRDGRPPDGPGWAACILRSQPQSESSPANESLRKKQTAP